MMEMNSMVSEERLGVGPVPWALVPREWVPVVGPMDVGPGSGSR
jgi:hypothetical protein